MADETKKPQRGCLRYGCIGGVVLLVLLLLGGLLGLHYAKKMFNDFTDTKPMPLPQVQMPRAQFDALEQRLDFFRQAVRLGQATAPLTLTSDEINALIAGDPDFEALKDKLYVTLAGDQIKGTLSVPMESVGLQLFKGRYLNGLGTFSLALRRGRLQLNVLSFQVKGKPVPEVYMEQIRQHNLAENANRQPRVQAALDHVQEVKIQDSKLVVVPTTKH